MQPNIVLSHSIACGQYEVQTILKELLVPLGYATSVLADNKDGHAKLDSRGSPFLLRTLDRVNIFECLLAHPDYRFVYLCRDFRDIAIVYAKRLMERRGFPPYFDMQRGMEAMIAHILPAEALLAADWLAAPGVMEVRFEDLERDPFQAIQGILNHCGLEVGGDTIVKALQKHGLVTVDARSGEVLPVQTLVDAPSGQYREVFDESMASLFELFLGKPQRALGYDQCLFGMHDKGARGALSFFHRSREPYYIYAPDYRQNSAGIRCLHNLCHMLNELGEEAYIHPAKMLNPKLRTPLLTDNVMKTHYLTGATPIVVYPEVVFGNPLKLPVVSRWLLNIPGHLGGDTIHGADDLMFYYQSWTLPEGVAGDSLYIPSVDDSLFNLEGALPYEDRQASCYYANKYLVFGGEVDKAIAEQSTSLCLDAGISPQDVANVLKRSKVIYCYERTSLIAEALACGCRVLMMPSDYLPLSECLGLVDIPKGVGVYGKSKELLTWRGEASTKDEEVRRQHEYSVWQVRRFVKLTQAAVKSRKEKFAGYGVDILEADLELGKAGVSVWDLPFERRRAKSHLFEKVYVRPDERSTDASPVAESGYQQWLATQSLSRQEATHYEALLAAASEAVVLVCILPGSGNREALSRTIASLSSQYYKGLRIRVFLRMPIPGVQNMDRIEWLPIGNAGFGELYGQFVSADSGWTLFLSEGDELEPHALVKMLIYARLNPKWQLVYADSDEVTPGTCYESPRFNPDFTLDYLRCRPGYIGKTMLVSREALNSFGHTPLEGMSALVLGVYDAHGPAVIGHLPSVLLHLDKSVSEVLDSPASERTAVTAHVRRQNPEAELVDGAMPGTFRVLFAGIAKEKVAIIVRVGSQLALLNRCLEGLLGKATYPDFEILLVDEGLGDEAMRSFVQGLGAMGDKRLRMIVYSGHSGPGAVWNATIKQTDASSIVFLDVDTTAILDYWLETLEGWLSQEHVGIVAPRYLNPHNEISESAVLLGVNGVAAYPFFGTKLEDPGYMNRSMVDQAFSAVAGPCMLIKREVWERVGGFDETLNLRESVQIDFCLKAGELGYSTIQTPYVAMLRGTETDHVSTDLSEGVVTDPADQDYFYTRWLHKLARDPAYNPNLSTRKRDFSVASHPVLRENNLPWKPVPRLLVQPADQEGCGHYRLLQPNRALNDDARIQGFETNLIFNPVEIEKIDADAIVLQRLYKPEQVAYVERLKKYSKSFRVMDLDDLFTNIPIKNSLGHVFTKDVVESLRTISGLCDRLVVSTQPLAEAYKGWCGDIRVVQNRLARKQWGDLMGKRRVGSKPRVGWAGAFGHEGDLAMIRDVVKATAKEVNWVFLGPVIPELAQYAKEVHKAVPIDKYPATLAALNLDLALAPLEVNAYNESKSHLKLLEYAAVGYPVICTDIYPYQGDFPVTRLPNKPNRWIHAIREHVRDMDALAAEGDRLRAHVHANWMLEDALDEWLAAWLPGKGV